MHGNGGILNHFVGNIVKVALGRFDHAFDNSFDSRVAQDLIGVGCLIDLSFAKTGFIYYFAGVIKPEWDGSDRQVTVDM